VLGAVIISMNPVVTAVLAAMFLGEGLTRTRVVALVLGVVAVLASCAGRLISVGGADPAVLLILVSLFSVAAGGVYQQKFCSGVDFRATAALQNAACVLPIVALAALMPWTVSDPVTAVGAVAAVVLLNAVLSMTLYVRGINEYGGSTVHQRQVEAAEQQALGEYAADQHVHERAACGPAHSREFGPRRQDGGRQTEAEYQHRHRRHHRNGKRANGVAQRVEERQRRRRSERHGPGRHTTHSCGQRVRPRINFHGAPMRYW
jgi:hypothetical protein